MCINVFQCLLSYNFINFYSDFGDAEVEQLTDHFRLILEEANVEVDKIGCEWTKLKHHINSRYNFSANYLS